VLEFIFLFEFREKASTSHSQVLSLPLSEIGAEWPGQILLFWQTQPAAQLWSGGSAGLWWTAKSLFSLPSLPAVEF